jgi:GDPmannose 4,6-dehydratase
MMTSPQYQKKKALITGIRGQDGSYLAELLLSKGYEVVGTSHQTDSVMRLEEGQSTVEVMKVDLGSTSDVRRLIETCRPNEVYNLAARSSSSQLFDDPIATADINAVAVVRFLEAIRASSPLTRFCQAASSEVFVGAASTPQDEQTALQPVNAYGAAKAYALNMVKAYRLQHGLHASTAILFNHESPRRGGEYVTRKISRTVALIANGKADSLTLGSLDSRRDWGYAADYVRAMWLMLQRPESGDYVIATGETHTVGEFCDIAFARVGLNFEDYVQIDPQLGRRVETIELRGNPAKARNILHWYPSVKFAEMVEMMVDADLHQVKND